MAQNFSYKSVARRHVLFKRNSEGKIGGFSVVKVTTEAKEWIIRNQFGRRNLTLAQRSELALKLEPLIQKKAKERMFSGKKKNSIHFTTTYVPITRGILAICHCSPKKAVNREQLLDLYQDFYNREHELDV
jgi:hypothetical protein